MPLFSMFTLVLILGVVVNSEAKVCADNEFKCLVREECIEQAWLCDGEEDCFDGSDELGCKVTCEGDQFLCDTGNCISAKEVCDHYNDCGDNSDERNCNNSPRNVFIFIASRGKSSRRSIRCASNYCLNNGRCEVVGNSRICRCPYGYEGYRCQISDNAPVSASRSNTISASILELLLCVAMSLLYL